MLLFLIETHSSGKKVERVCKRCGFDSFRIQNAQGQPEGIWVLWNSEDSRMDVLASEEQFVHMRLALSKGEPWLIIGVYGSPQYQRRNKLWDGLTNITSSCLEPWQF